jgi:hypothetical protein
MHRQGDLHLTLVLPDGSRSLIPAAWTNLDIDDRKDRPVNTSASERGVLGSISDLTHTRKIVDALLRKLDSSTQVKTSLSKEESVHANRDLAYTAGIDSRVNDLEGSQQGRAKICRLGLGSADQSSDLSRDMPQDTGRRR